MKKINIAITGCLGRMGQQLIRSIKQDKNFIKTGQTLLLSQSKDLYFLGDDNFIAITKYNRSHFYAKAVYDLSLKF